MSSHARDRARDILAATARASEDAVLWLHSPERKAASSVHEMEGRNIRHEASSRHQTPPVKVA